MNRIKFSVIIPVLNSEETLDQCLGKILSVDFEKNKYEVIVVDNGSIDNSIKIAEKHSVKVIVNKEVNISGARNFGASYASGQYYAFLDSDCLVDKHWLKEALHVFETMGASATGSGYLTPQDFSWVEKAWLIESRLGPHETKFLPGGNFFINADVFNHVGGFDESLNTGEDSDMAYRIAFSGYKIINSPKIKNVHLGNAKSIINFFKKEVWYGENIIENLKKNLLDIISLVTFFFTIIYILLIILSIKLLLNYSYFCLIIFFVLIFISMLVCFAFSIFRVLRSKKYKLFFHIFVLYNVYFFARSKAFLRELMTRKKLYGK